MVGRIAVTAVSPTVSCAQYPSRAVTGQTITVSATVFREGHDAVAADVVVRAPDGTPQPFLRMQPGTPGTDRWSAPVTFPDDLSAQGAWSFSIEAWSDPLGTWWHDAPLKVEAGVDVEMVLQEGALLYDRAMRSVPSARRAALRKLVKGLRDGKGDPLARLRAALDPEVVALLSAHPLRELVTATPAQQVWVDRERALYGAWYEFFPRSEGAAPDADGVLRSGTFATATQRLPAVAEMGFDVVYLPPIHPIGEVNRKGPNNTLTAGPDDPGSPWAIGAAEGGHDAVHPELGTVEDLRALTADAQALGIDIALDFAIQASADHPWLEEHPEWFHRRPDGTLKYAENPPKRYQDIYNFNWESADWRVLWEALLAVVLGWVDCGVKVFRVDNPHTKPFAFWEWLIAQVHERDRDVVFLAEAFTRHAVMRQLAKLGFSQSYTYFTWKNSRWELSEYVSELVFSGEAEYFRPNFFTNTPDILHAYLQHGGPAAFEARLALAATLSPSYGIYSGYEHFENVPVREGSEEYLDSEKYAAKERALDGPLLPMVARLNAARRDNPALHHLANVRFLETENDALIAYGKRSGANIVITVVNVDPHQTQSGVAIVPAELGTPPAFSVHDLLSDEHYAWRIGPNFVRLEPGNRQAHVLRVEA